MESGQRATRICLMDEDFELDDVWDCPWVEKWDAEAEYYGEEPDYLKCLLNWEKGKVLCPVPLFTPQTTALLSKANLVNTFEHYPIDRLSQREVEAIMIIRAESDRILDEKREDPERKK